MSSGVVMASGVGMFVGDVQGERVGMPMGRGPIISIPPDAWDLRYYRIRPTSGWYAS